MLTDNRFVENNREWRGVFTEHTTNKSGVEERVLEGTGMSRNLMDSIREVEEGYALNDEYPDHLDAHSPSTSTDDLAEMAASGRGDLSGGGGSGSPLVKRARKLLYRRFRVGVEDGRIFVGKFHCLDKQGNIILYDTLEYRQVSQGSSPSESSGANANSSGMEQRSLGLVLIPAHCRTSCFVECSIHEQFSLLAI